MKSQWAGDYTRPSSASNVCSPLWKGALSFSTSCDWGSETPSVSRAPRPCCRALGVFSLDVDADFPNVASARLHVARLQSLRRNGGGHGRATKRSYDIIWCESRFSDFGLVTRFSFCWGVTRCQALDTDLCISCFPLRFGVLGVRFGLRTMEMH